MEGGLERRARHCWDKLKEECREEGKREEMKERGVHD